MARKLLVPVAVLVLAALDNVRLAQAGPAPPVPQQPAASIYLAGTRVKVTVHLSNSRKSCQWNLDCVDGLPRTHTHNEDALGRVGGWMSFAEWNSIHRRQMTFTLFGSAYDTPAHARAAAADFNEQLTGRTFGLSTFSCETFVRGQGARQFCARYYDHSQVNEGHYFSLAASRGTLEIELLSHANTRFKDLKRVTFALARAAMAADGTP